MTKYYFILLLSLLASCPAFSAPAISSFDSVQMAPKKWKMSSILKNRIQFRVGVDPEKSRQQRNYQIPFVARLNVGLGYRLPMHKNWSICPEIGFQQFSTPLLTVMRDEKYELDGDRIQLMDTTAVFRMAGYNIGLSLQRETKMGFIFSAGVQCGFYKKGLSESGYKITDYHGYTVIGSSVALDGNKDLPSWFNRVQPGVRIGAGKVFFKRLELGATLYQGLTDITNLPSGGNNFSTNWVVYLGLRI